MMDELNEELGREYLVFDPAEPHPSFFPTATALSLARSYPGLPEPVPFPPGLAPRPAPPEDPPNSRDKLPAADILLVTWTAAEARAMSILFTPGVRLEDWFQYKHNLRDFIPKVTGRRAPFNDRRLKRYYHSLGLYFPCTVGEKRVLCFKSGLHMDYDGPDLPLLALWKQIIADTGAGLVITTGTAGGVGDEVRLGDVVIAADTLFDCTTKFKEEPFRSKKFKATGLPEAPAQRITPALVRPNAEHVARAGAPTHKDGLPKFFYPGSTIRSPKIVTTDFFAFDDSLDSAGLQELGNACEMGDATLGLVLSQMASAPQWVAIRNASDPQIDGNLSPADRRKRAGLYYRNYGGFTTAASLIACWSVICEKYGLASPPAEELEAEELAPAVATTRQRLARSKAAERQSDPAFILLQLAASTDLKIADVDVGVVPGSTVDALRDRLALANLDISDCEVAYRRISFRDEARRSQVYFLAQVSNDDAVVFRGGYLFSGVKLVAKEEFVSS